MRDAAYYRAEAAKYREMAKDSDESTAAALRRLADDFEQEANRLEPPAEPPSLA